jgi:hypothetical protein
MVLRALDIDVSHGCESFILVKSMPGEWQPVHPTPFRDAEAFGTPASSVSAQTHPPAAAFEAALNLNIYATVARTDLV